MSKNKKKKPLKKTHEYKMLKFYKCEEMESIISSVEEDGFFMDLSITASKIKTRRASAFSVIGYECDTKGCNLHDFKYGIGVDNGGGIHLDLYAFDDLGEMVMITIDHIKPKSKGGPNHISNYAPLCKICNEIKSDYFEPEVIV